MARLPRVAIIGRANVGKSTLFNRLSNGSRALVSDRAGTTRDRKEGVCTWLGRQFAIIDTGGLNIDTNLPIERKTAEQAERAARDADLVLFVVDTKDGIMPADSNIARLLRPLKDRVLLVANKADTLRLEAATTDFYELGFGAPWTVSAISGRGTGDLLDHIASRITASLYTNESAITVALIGKPNVGKSSLLNALLGEERAIVHHEPYTTRDANEHRLTYKGVKLLLLDTAGVRRKSKIDAKSIEAESVQQSLAAIRSADVVLFITDVHEKLTAQDLQLARLIDESRASTICIANKWDAIEDKTADKMTEFEEYYRHELNFLYWAPLIFVSALEKMRVPKLKDLILEVFHERSRVITENALSKFLSTAVKRQRPLIGKGTKKPFIYRLRQDGINPPQSAVVIDHRSSLRYSYLNFLERMLREKFGFVGVPIKMWVEKNRDTRR